MTALALTLAEVSMVRAEISFEWVTVGDPGNPNDPLSDVPTGGVTPPVRGAVPYVYSISKYETTIGQWASFLNAVAKSNPERAHSLYSSQLAELRSVSGIARLTINGKDVYHLMHGAGGIAYLPITFIDYLDAVRFVNWLHNGQGDGDTETGAYTINASGQPMRSPNARYWIPTENEWYKAAYYDPSSGGPPDDYWQFPWRNFGNSRPGNFFAFSPSAGTDTYAVTNRARLEPYQTYLSDVRAYADAASYYGTLNQAGNVDEWTEGDAFSGGPHTRGGYWDLDTSGIARNIFARMASFASPFDGQPGQPGPQHIGFRVATGASPPLGGLKNGDKLRFFPREGHNNRMVGGVFEALDGTVDRPNTVLYTITEPPPNGWTEVEVDFGAATAFRFRAPDGAHGNVAEIEFYRSGAKVIAAASGTPGSWSNLGNTYDRAFDGDVSTFFDAPEPNGAYVQVDTGSAAIYDAPRLPVLPANYDHLRVDVAGKFGVGEGDYPPGRRVGVRASPPDGQSFAGWEGFTSLLDDPTASATMATIPGLGTALWIKAILRPLPPGSHNLLVTGGNGSGVYPTGTRVTVTANPSPAGQQFSGWTGDIAILSNPFLPTTSALVPTMDVSVFATYSAAGLADTIRFYPRVFHTARMVGGIFEGTNGDPSDGPYQTIYTISNTPSPAWNEVQVDFRDYRYLRYRGPTNSFGNVAEIEFSRAGTKLSGTGFGTPGSWSNQGSTFDKALDGNLDTFFDASVPTGAYVGIDTGAAPVSTDKIRFYPRLYHTARMVGGVFEGTNGDPVNGPYETIYTIPSNPPPTWNEVDVNLKDYRHLRYRGPTESFGNVAEIEFYRDGLKVTGQGFGTPGSWNNQGSTFDKALDGNLDTFFDATIPTGAYVGIGPL